MLLWRLATRGLGIINLLILAHILVPQDFGIVAIATTYLAAFDAISAFGLEDAIVRASGSGEKLHDTAFTLSIIRSAVNGALVAISAPFAAQFFNEPRVAAVLYVLAVLAVVEGFENIGVVGFQRDMRFDKEFQLFLIPRLVSVAVSIICALIFRSYWALVIGIAAQRLVRFGATYLLHPFRPRLSISEWRQISGFSFWTWAASVASFARDRSWTVIVGKFFDPASVGRFSMASEIGLLPVSEFILPICRALFSGFALARHEGVALGPAFARTLGVVALAVLPAAIGISAIGNYVVDLALGIKWGEVIPIVQIIAGTAPFVLLTAIGATIMNACGFVQYNFWIVSTSAVIGAAANAFMAARVGLNGVAVATGLTMMFEGMLFLAIAARAVKASWSNILFCLWRPLLSTLVMAATLLGTGFGWQAGHISAGNRVMECVVAIAIGAASYVASLLILWRLSRDPDSSELFLINLVRKNLRRGQDAMADSRTT